MHPLAGRNDELLDTLTPCVVMRSMSRLILRSVQ